MENEQITGSHKYRLVYGMMTQFLLQHSLDSFEGFVEASSGNTGLALAELAQQINKQCVIITTENIDPKIARKITERDGRLIFKDDIDACIALAQEWETLYNYVNLNQYDNPDAVLGFQSMAEEMVEQHVVPTTIVMGVGTGATITGLTNVLHTSRAVACSIDDEFLTITGWKNFKVNKPGQVLIDNGRYINRWELLTLSEIAEAQESLSKTLGFKPNLSTVGNLLVAIKEGNLTNDSTIITVCTGIDE